MSAGALGYGCLHLHGVTCSFLSQMLVSKSHSQSNSVRVEAFRRWFSHEVKSREWHLGPYRGFEGACLSFCPSATWRHTVSSQMRDFTQHRVCCCYAGPYVIMRSAASQPLLLREHPLQQPDRRRHTGVAKHVTIQQNQASLPTVAVSSHAYKIETGTVSTTQTLTTWKTNQPFTRMETWEKAGWGSSWQRTEGEIMPGAESPDEHVLLHCILVFHKGRRLVNDVEIFMPTRKGLEIWRYILVRWHFSWGTRLPFIISNVNWIEWRLSPYQHTPTVKLEMRKTRYANLFHEAEIWVLEIRYKKTEMMIYVIL